MIPVKIDIETILRELGEMGWRDYKVEVSCHLPNGYIGKLRNGKIKVPSYEYAARLSNFWEYEAEHAALAYPRTLANTT